MGKERSRRKIPWASNGKMPTKNAQIYMFHFKIGIYIKTSTINGYHGKKLLYCVGGSVVTQRATLLPRDDAKNGCEGD